MTTQELEQLGKLIDAKLEPIKKDMATKSDIQATTTKIEATTQEIVALMKQDREDMADFFNETWRRMGATDQRVTTIEDHLGLPHPHKN
jgi:hypothetical protein